MRKINPDFRTIEEVYTPRDLRQLTGWSQHVDPDERELIDTERRTLADIEASQPDRFQTQVAKEIPAEMLAKWTEFQKNKGRYEGSADWSLLDEFAHGQALVWLPQIIGSCVCSNTLRPWVARLMYQIVLLGDSMEYLGRGEFGPKNYSFYGPYTYGEARKKANMKGSDGLYCAPMAWSLMQGVVACNEPKLLEILQDAGFARDKDFPEPQSKGLYRAFGNWQYIDRLKPYADFALEESPSVTSADQLWDLLQVGKTAFQCSMEAIHKIGDHPDGFPIHARNPRDRWAHNMSWQGCFIASDGERFFRMSNESWGANHIYNRKFDEVDRAFRSGRLTVQAIGQIAGPSSSPPKIG